MKFRNTLMILTTTLLFGNGNIANAAPGNEVINKADEEQLQARLEAEYKKAMTAAEQQQSAAEASMEKARVQLEQTSAQRELANKQSDEIQSAREAELAKMNEELNNARRQLQETSREIARVNREIARARSHADRNSTRIVYRASEKPVIGVILGDVDDGGVKILGVSPDGPAERGGVKQGDVIIAVNGRKLTAVEQSGDARKGLGSALKDMKADEPVTISVVRDKRNLDLTVVPEVREPLAWQSITRFPSAPPVLAVPPVPPVPGLPADPEQVMTIESIVVPEIDTEAMSAQIGEMRAEIEKRVALREALGEAPAESTWQIEIDELSELGNLALQDADIWFGLPLAQGLQLAEIDPGLGEYFKTDRGVLVLKAKTDNDLQLQSGDVILQVGDTAVNTPAEFMRALRGLDSGDELVMGIKRDRKERTLKTVMPERGSSFYLPWEGKTHTFTITSSAD